MGRVYYVAPDDDRTFRDLGELLAAVPDGGEISYYMVRADSAATALACAKDAAQSGRTPDVVYG